MKIDYFDIARSVGATAIRKTANELRKQGFDVEEEKQVENERIDLFARKGNKKIVYEFCAGRNSLKRERYERLQKIARELSATLKIVYVVPPPTEIQIQFDDLPSIIDKDLRDLREIKLTAISGLAGFDITDLTITKIQVYRGYIRVEGSGIIECATLSSNLYFMLTLDMQLNVIERNYDYPELKLTLKRDDDNLLNSISNIKQQYEILAKDIIGNAFYSEQSSYSDRINKERQYTDLILRKLLNIDETSLKLQAVLDKIKTLPDHVFILKALKTLHAVDTAGTEVAEATNQSEQDYITVTDALFDLLASLLINYFSKYKFGSRPEIMRTFSLLPPVIRRKILFYLYNNPDKSTNITAQTGKKNVALIDKLVLAILKADGEEKAYEWLDEHGDELSRMKAIDMDFYEKAKRERGNEYAEFLYNIAPTMYQSCLEKIKILGKQIELEGALYLDFESAKPYYEQNGFIYGDNNDDEIKEFNDIMAFMYMGRRSRNDNGY